MAKKWSEVEQSETYQNLPPQSKIMAKKQYWNDVVSIKSNYITLDDKSKQKAKQQFFGGILAEDMEDSSINVPMETAKGTLSTIGKSTGKLVEPILHPIQTAKGLYYAAKHPIQTAKAIGQDYKEAYGGVENIAETVAEDPARFLTDVSLLGAVSGKGLQITGKSMKSAKGAKVIESGRFPTVTQGKGLETFKEGAEKTVQAMSKMKKSPQKMADEATRAYREILNPGKGEIKAVEIKGGKDINRYYRLAAEEGLPIKQTIDVGNSPKLNTIDAIDKLKPKVALIHEELNTVLAGQKKTFDLMDIADSSKKALVGAYKNASELKKAKMDIDRYIAAEIQRHGQMVNATTLNEIKQGMWSVGYNALKPTAKKSARVVGGTIRRNIESAFPAENIQKLNSLSGDYQGLINLLEEANGRIVQGGKIGKYFAQGTGALAGGLAASPIPGVGPIGGAIIGREVGSRLSKVLNNPELKSAKAADKMREAMSRMPKAALDAVPEIEIPILNRLRLPAPQRKLLERKQGPLLLKHDKSYVPTGKRNIPEKGITTPERSSQGVIYQGTEIPKIYKQTPEDIMYDKFSDAQKRIFMNKFGQFQSEAGQGFLRGLWDKKNR